MDRKPSRIYVTETIESDIDFAEPLEILTVMLDGFKEDYAKWKNLRIEYEYSGDGYSGKYSIYSLVGDRLENDKEYMKRFSKFQKARKVQKATKEQKEKEDQEEYERLKKKFEKGNKNERL